MMRGPIGFLPIARHTFDVPFAAAAAERGLETLADGIEWGVAGSSELAMDPATVGERTAELTRSDVEAVVVFQATFADSTLIREVARSVSCPIVLWAIPEERTGERLRRNSLCGINLAAYVLARDGVDYRWVYRSETDSRAGRELEMALSDPKRVELAASVPQARPQTGPPPSLQGSRIGVVGSRPEGFEPCDYDPATLREMLGISVDRVELGDLFAAAEASGKSSLRGVRSDLEGVMTGLDQVDQPSLDRSLSIYLGLSSLVESRGWHGVATRCWPECFTEFGGAACAPNSLLTSRGIPGCCEADVYGDVTALLLQELSDGAPFVADLVDLDRDSNTAAFWHCGLAPTEMAPEGRKPRATIHPNRRKPLLNEFPLRPGRVTISRVSQSRNRHSLLVAGAEMLDAPLPFSGTSGVARLDTDVDEALDVIMANGLEHHYGITYGDHREGLRSYAGSIGIPVIEL